MLPSNIVSSLALSCHPEGLSSKSNRSPWGIRSDDLPGPSMDSKHHCHDLALSTNELLAQSKANHSAQVHKVDRVLQSYLLSPSWRGNDAGAQILVESWHVKEMKGRGYRWHGIAVMES